MQTLEIVLFVGAVIGVIALGIWKAKKDEQGSGSSKGGEASDYFLAGRGLTWWLVGFSLIAANISTEQFVGMSGSAANWLGMAIASYEWMAAVTLVGVAFFFLPRFLKTGLYTIPEFLQYRFGVGPSCDGHSRHHYLGLGCHFFGDLLWRQVCFRVLQRRSFYQQSHHDVLDDCNIGRSLCFRRWSEGLCLDGPYLGSGFDFRWRDCDVVLILCFG